MKRYLPLAVAAIVLLAGCAEESSRPVATGEGTVRAINAISTSPDFGFLIEERFLGSLSYKSASATGTWDDLEYTFNFDVLLTGDVERTRVASVFIDVEKDRDYTMVLTGAVDAPDVVVWEADIREWNGDETFYEIRFANLSNQLGPVDIYFDMPGVAPVAGNEVGTLDFGEVMPAMEVESGERVLILTPAGDPGTVLYESVTLTLLAANTYILSPFDADANDVGAVPTRVINLTTGGIGLVADASTQATARFFHTSQGMGNADIYADDPLTVPVVSNQAFGEVTGDMAIAPGDTPITYTAAGNAGSILIDVDRTFNVNVHHSLFAIRNSDGEDVLTSFIIDRRSVETQTKFTLINTTVNHPVVDVYIVLSGESIDDTFALLPSLTTLAAPFTAPILPNQYDIYVTVQNEKTVLLGPIPFDAQAGDVIEAMLIDTVDPNVPAYVIVPPP